MKKIINGRLYDTATAELIDSRACGEDIDRIEETLYRKKTGEFFLHGSGGPRTSYAKECGSDSYGWDEEIIPEDSFDVKEWVADYCDADTYIKLFGPVEE